MIDARTRELERKLNAYYKERERSEKWDRRKAQLRRGVEVVERGGRAVTTAARGTYQVAAKGYSQAYSQTRDVGRTINKQGGAPNMLSGGMFSPRAPPIANRNDGVRNKKGGKKVKTSQRKGGVMGPVFSPFKY